MIKILYATILLSGTGTLYAQQSATPAQQLFSRFEALQAAASTGSVSDVAARAEDFIRTASTVDYKEVSEGNLNLLRLDATAVSEQHDLQKQKQILSRLAANMALLQQNLEGQPAAKANKLHHGHH